MDVATDLLHCHPAQVELSPEAYVELLAVREIRHEAIAGPTLCKSCRKARLIGQLEKDNWLTCDDCEKPFEDPDIRRQLEAT